MAYLNSVMTETGLQAEQEWFSSHQG